jgi:hypothetical protein
MPRKSRPEKDHPNVLIVEGKSEVFAIAELMEANGIPWQRGSEPVFVDNFEGVTEIEEFVRDSAEFSRALKNSGRQAFGIVVDADESVARRWEGIRNVLNHLDDPKVPDVPEKIGSEGFITTADNGVRLGVWIMPDNLELGMLETFLAFLIDDKKEPLWEFAQATVDEAKAKGAPFKPSHLHKARIHTWLAWQDEPGPQLHMAVAKRILNPTHPKAQPFVNWFKTLFEL